MLNNKNSTQVEGEIETEPETVIASEPNFDSDFGKQSVDIPWENDPFGQPAAQSQDFFGGQPTADPWGNQQSATAAAAPWPPANQATTGADWANFDNDNDPFG